MTSVYIAEIVSFLIIIALVVRYAVPAIKRTVAGAQERIAKQAQDADEAKARLAEAERAYQNAVHEARTESAQIRENARAEAQRTVEELRAAAEEESDRIIARGEEQLQNQRSAVVRDLRAEIGTLAVELSEKIVAQRLAEEGQVSASVDAFLVGLESGENSGRSGSRGRRRGQGS